MSPITRWWRRLLAWANAPVPTARATFSLDQDLDAMSLRDWSDLPAHHPRCEQAPC